VSPDIPRLDATRYYLALLIRISSSSLLDRYPPAFLGCAGTLRSDIDSQQHRKYQKLSLVTDQSRRVDCPSESVLQINREIF
jgi:hypothetical protein